MKSKDIFHLAVRLLGLVFLHHGFTSLPLVLTGVWIGLLYAICHLAVAWWLLTTHWLTNRAFTDAAREEKKGNELAAGVGQKADA